MCASSNSMTYVPDTLNLYLDPPYDSYFVINSITKVRMYNLQHPNHNRGNHLYGK